MEDINEIVANLLGAAHDRGMAQQRLDDAHDDVAVADTEINEGMQALHKLTCPSCNGQRGDN